MVTLEFPAATFDALRGPIALPDSPGDAASDAHLVEAARSSGRRVRFSKAEQKLLVRLKEHSRPKMSWKEIRDKHFPHRTRGSLQVHYCTQLKLKRSHS